MTYLLGKAIANYGVRRIMVKYVFDLLPEYITAIRNDWQDKKKVYCIKRESNPRRVDLTADLWQRPRLPLPH